MEILLIISILFQLIAVLIAISLIKITERYFAWLLIAIAISLMAIRRLITLISIFQGVTIVKGVTLAEYVALIISILISIGLFFMIPIFKSIKKNEFELAEKNKLLKKEKEKAEESNRLKTAFLQNMSHEIRTPLNAILGFSGILNKPKLPEEKRKHFISIIQNSSNQLLSIVTDILTISSLETKQEKCNISSVCINYIIADLLAIFKQQAKSKNILFYAKPQLSDKQSEIYSDKTKITQILTNLLSNALKFTSEGFVEFGYNVKGNELEFYVKDSGIGIEKEMQAIIFERFRQANNNINKKYSGTGLGLAISKEFTELLGGKIRVQSEPGKGSTFYFTIQYKPVNENNKSTITTKQNKNCKTILVAEDEEYNFFFIREILINTDLTLIHAKDGQETVEICKTNSKIDLILMDIKMPVMDGYEAAMLIKGFKPDLPIIAQSAYDLETENKKYSRIFDDFLAKPINGEILIEKVYKYID
ncbi:MAG: response regulator [Chlorobi bacterium]|nr:response regulator [Chlorobiota bacterium]